MSAPVDNDLDLVPSTNSANNTSASVPSSANGSSVENAKNTVIGSKCIHPYLQTAQSAMDAIANHPITQNVKDTTINGEYTSPVGQKVQEESAKTSNEFRDLANARQVPDQPAATGQPLTHYHSMFYRLLSWKNPRATGISFAVTVLFIFAARYLNIIRYLFKGTYMVMGVTAAAEIASQLVLGNGMVTQMRPRKYWTFPKESLERALDDVEQLINFFVIEFQRILFVENIWVTVGAFITSFISYYLVKFVPLWGLTLIGDCIVFLAPLVYVTNKEFIDENLRNAGHAINEQTTQIKDLAVQHTGNATETIRQYTSEYTAKAQELMGQTQHRNRQKVQESDFPAAPKTDIKTGSEAITTGASTGTAQSQSLPTPAM